MKYNLSLLSGDLLVTKPENVMLIHPPIRIIGRTFVTLPFIMSVSIVGSKTKTQRPLHFTTAGRGFLLILSILNLFDKVIQVHCKKFK